MDDILNTIRDAFRGATIGEIAGDAIGAICVFAIPFLLLFIGYGLGY
ncbi:hypothetical protein [uncultured Planktomarina sp.]